MDQMDQMDRMDRMDWMDWRQELLRLPWVFTRQRHGFWGKRMLQDFSRLCRELLWDFFFSTGIRRGFLWAIPDLSHWAARLPQGRY